VSSIKIADISPAFEPTGNFSGAQTPTPVERLKLDQSGITDSAPTESTPRSEQRTKMTRKVSKNSKLSNLSVNETSYMSLPDNQPYKFRKLTKSSFVTYPKFKKALTRQARAFQPFRTKVKATRMVQQHLSASQKPLVSHQLQSAHFRISQFFWEFESTNLILSREIMSRLTLQIFREVIQKEEFKILSKKRCRK